MSHEQTAPIAVARRLASELPPEELQVEVLLQSTLEIPSKQLTDT